MPRACGVCASFTHVQPCPRAIICSVATCSYQNGPLLTNCGFNPPLLEKYSSILSPEQHMSKHIFIREQPLQAIPCEPVQQWETPGRNALGQTPQVIAQDVLMDSVCGRGRPHPSASSVCNFSRKRPFAPRKTRFLGYVSKSVSDSEAYAQVDNRK